MVVQIVTGKRKNRDGTCVVILLVEFTTREIVSFSTNLITSQFNEANFHTNERIEQKLKNMHGAPLI